MSSFSPGLGNGRASVAPGDQCHISSCNQRHPSNTRALRVFKSVIKSCYGPSGHLKMIQNRCGGHATVTSSSRRLLKSLSLSKPPLKLIAAAVEAHSRVYSDGGLYTALLACTLVEKCWESGIHPLLCVAVNELALGACLGTMHSCRVPLNVASMDALLSLVQSVIGSKRGCGMLEHEKCLVASLVLRSFVASIPDAGGGQRIAVPQIQIVGVGSRTISESRVVEGILVEAPEIPAAFKRDVRAPRLLSGLHGGDVRVALFNISLAGDSEEFINARYGLSPGISMEDGTVSAMTTLINQLVDLGVGLVACQKVIHPSIKQYARKKGVLTVDRLSLLHIGAVQQITGAGLISSLDPNVPSSAFGHLTDVRHEVMFGRSYLVLTNAASALCTLVLCNLTEQALDELKHVCQVAHHILALTLRDPAVLPGAGCLEVIMAHDVRRQMSICGEGTWQDLGCRKIQYLQLVDNFASCLEEVAVAIDQEGGNHITDSSSHHRWHLPPGARAEPDWTRGLGRCGCGEKAANEHGAGEEWRDVAGLKDGVERLLHLGQRGIDKETTITKDGNADECAKDGQGIKSPDGTQNSQGHGSMCIDTISDGVAGSETASHKMVNMDSFAVKRNAFRVAVETANLVLRMGHTIEDPN